MGDTFVSENLCLNKVTTIVSEHFKSKFIPFTGDIDNGLDGVILWRDKGNIIDSIYVQCKGGDSYLPKLPEGKNNYSQKFKLNLSPYYVQKHYDIWTSASGPVILVVCNSNKKAWWADLKAEETYADFHSKVIIDPKNVFNKSAYDSIRAIVRSQRYINGRAEVHADGGFLHGCLGGKTIKEVAQNYYQSLGKKKLESPNPELNGKIEFTRVGWRHILRTNRRKSRMLQSLLLLPVIPSIIKNSPSFTYLNVEHRNGKNGEDIILEKLGIQAACKFDYRYPGVVQIVLLRKKTITEDSIDERIWFYSIYEMSRNKQIEEATY